MALFQKVIKEYGGFQEAIEMIGEENLEKFCDKIYLTFCEQYKNAGYMMKIKWLIRHFYASKKMTLSALFFTQTVELNNKNFKNITFYTSYYALFNALSSNLILLPYLEIDKVFKISHSQIFKDIDNYFVKNKIYDNEIISILNELRLTRELYSYQLPLGGSIVGTDKTLNVDSLFNRLDRKIVPILQISNLISYMSYYAWEKKAGSKEVDEYESHQSEVDNLFFSFIKSKDYLGEHCVIDDADYYLQEYVLNKWKTPFPISWFITEKMCEELECGWEQNDDNDENGFDISNVAQFLSCI